MEAVDFVYSFLWDIFDSLLNYESIGFVLHGPSIFLSDSPGLISPSGGMFDRLLPRLCKSDVYIGKEKQATHNLPRNRSSRIMDLVSSSGSSPRLSST
jgi:hypothetical protein